MSLYTLFFAGSTPFGSLLIGAISDGWDPGTALVVSAAIAAVGLALAWLYLRGKSERDFERGTVFEQRAVIPVSTASVNGATAATSRAQVTE